MLNLGAIAKLIKALKVVNQRIAQIRKTFGKTSQIYQEVIGKFKTSDLEKYIHTSRGGDLAFKYGTIAKDLTGPEANQNMKKLERILNVAGYKPGKNGYLRKTDAGPQVKTVREIRREWRQILDPNYELKNKQLDDLIENSIEYKNTDFSEIYYEYRSRFGGEVADKRYQELLGREASGKLTREEVFEIRSGMIRDLGVRNMQQRKEQEMRLAKYGKKGLRTFSNGGFKNE